MTLLSIKLLCLCTLVVIFQPVSLSIHPNRLDMPLFSVFTSLFLMSTDGGRARGNVTLFAVHFAKGGRFLMLSLSASFFQRGISDPCIDTYNLIMIKHHISPISFNSDSEGLNVLFTEGTSLSSPPRQQKKISYFIIQTAISFLLFQDDNNLSNSHNFNNNYTLDL